MGTHRTGRLLLALILATACATAPSGRRQLMLVSDRELEPAAAASFEQLRARVPESDDQAARAALRCILDHLVAELPPAWRGLEWRLTLFASPEVNAFALPGGRIGVYAGLLARLPDQDRLAAVLGHEIGHVVFRHGAERVSQHFAAATALELAALARDGGRDPQSQRLLALLGLGAQLGVLLPFSRLHEQEADRFGQELMARAGFDPRAAAEVWESLGQERRPPAWLSTHPAPESRRAELAARARALEPVFSAARDAGRRPECLRPR
ncbi:MAG: M48 family metallopeptidase [Xanthomonadales bacterium]|nr:M48 family metallopeptidase [Xanthomonadales bacterium]